MGYVSHFSLCLYKLQVNFSIFLFVWQRILNMMNEAFTKKQLPYTLMNMKYQYCLRILQLVSSISLYVSNFNLSLQVPCKLSFEI